MNSEKDLACEARERLTVPAPVQAQPFSLFSQLAVLAPPSDSAGSPQADQLAEERKSQGIRRRQELGESARKEYTTTILYLLENADNPLPTAQLLRHLAITARHNFASLLKTLTKEELR